MCTAIPASTVDLNLPQVNFISKGNLFERNSATSPGGPQQEGPMGGAVALLDVGEATFMDTIFRNNSATNDGDKGLPGGAGAVHIKVPQEPQVRFLSGGNSAETVHKLNRLYATLDCKLHTKCDTSTDQIHKQ